MSTVELGKRNYKPKVILLNLTGNMPYGLMYIAGYLRKHGVDCSITSNLYTTLEHKPDIIGLSDMFTETHDKVMNIAKALKLHIPKVRIVVGGNHISSFPVLQKEVDHIVIGEGEQAMLDIVKGCTDKIIKRPMLNIDDIPMPAYNLVDVERYITKGVNPFSMRKRTMGIISSRGCPNNCAYCSIGAVWGKSWRGRDPKLVVDEIEYLQRKYKVHEFSFLDDSISINKKRLEGICHELITRKLNIKWTTPNGIAHWTLTKDLLTLMKKAGCYRVTFGIESGSEKIRKYIGKSYDLNQASDLIKHANKIGLWTITTNIIGLPYEDVADINKTLEYAIKCGTDFACFYQLIPHKGTRIAKDVDKITLPHLDTWQRMMYREFLMSRIIGSPLRLFRKVKSFEDLLYMFKLIKMGIKVFLNTFKGKGHVLYD